MLHYRSEGQVLPIGVGVKPHFFETLLCEFVLIFSHPFSIVATTSQLFAALLRPSQLFSILLTTLLNCSQVYHLFPQLNSFTFSHLFATLLASPHLSSTLLNDSHLCPPLSTLFNSSHLFSPLAPSSQLFPRLLTSSQLISPLLSSSRLFSPLVNSSHLSSCLFTEKLLHRDAFTQRSFYTEPAYTQRSFYEKLSHRESVTQRSFYTKKLLRRDAFTQRSFYTEKLLLREALTRRNFHTEKLQRTWWRQKLQLQNRISVPKPKKDDFGAVLEINLREKSSAPNWQITIKSLMQPLQYDLRLSNAKPRNSTCNFKWVLWQSTSSTWTFHTVHVLHG